MTDRPPSGVSRRRQFEEFAAEPTAEGVPATARPLMANSVLRQVEPNTSAIPRTLPEGEILSATGAVPQSGRLCVSRANAVGHLDLEGQTWLSARVVAVPA